MTENAWSAELETGNEVIDNQHQELFHLVSLLDCALVGDDARAKLQDIVVFLEHYVEEHFAEEEHVMLDAHYKGYDIHKADHEIFKARVFSLRHDFDSQVPNTRLFFAIRMFIDKLVYHIRTIDIGIAGLVHGAKEPH